MICALACAFAGCRAPAAKPDLSGYLENRKAAVFVFLAPDCPLSQRYTLTLNELHAEFRDDGIGFYGLVAGNDFYQSEIDRFSNEYKLAFPVRQDPDFALADLWGASKTPEAFFVSASGETLYKGAIDNWYEGLGAPRTVITEHYLKDALDNFLLGKDLRHKETAAAGCFIERKRYSPD